MADRDEGQLVPYAPRSPKERAETSRALNLKNPPAGVVMAQPASSVIASWVETKTKRRKTDTHTYQLTDGVVFAGLGILFLYELDKAVTAWAGSLGADLSGLNPSNWVAAGLNAGTAMDIIKQAEQEAQKTSPTPPPSKKSSGSGSNVGYVVGKKVGAQSFDQFWANLFGGVREDFKKHPFGGPF